MTADEKEVFNYLKSWRGQFVSGAEVARRAGGKRRYSKDPNWAVPILGRLVEHRLIEADATGHFRVVMPSPKDSKTKWLSPQIRKILEKSGHVEQAIDVEDMPDDTSGRT